jgi:hypothetical protein
VTKRLVIALGSVLVALAIVATAWAHFTSGGAGTATASVGSLNAPAKPSASPNGTGRVDIGWHRATLSNGTTPAQHYYVSRYSGSTLDGYACGTSPTGMTIADGAADINGDFTCSDTGLTNAGPYTYTVTAVYKSFSAESTKSDPVTVSLVAPLDHFVLSAATTSPTAGVADNLTITAKDASNNTITSYTGSHNLTFSGASSIGSNNPTVTNSSGTAIAFGSSTAINFVNGVSTVSSGSNGAMTLYKAETASIVVSDGTHSNGSGLSVTVGPAGAASLSLAAATTTPTAGVADNLTITAKDAFGNTATGYTGDKSLTFGGASSIGSNNPTVTNKTGTAVNFGTAETISFSNGVASVSGSNNGVMKLVKAETASITVSDGTISNGSGLSVTVAPAGAASLSLAAATTTPTAGVADNLTITAKDAFGNTATGYSGDKSLTFGGAANAPDGAHPTVTNKTGTAVNFGTAEMISFSSGVASVSGSNNGVMKLYKAETASITVSDGSISNGSGLSVTVSSTGTATKLLLAAQTSTPVVGATNRLTITAQDTFGNTEPSYTGDKSVTFTGAANAPDGTHPTVTDKAGTAVNFGTAETITFSNGVASASASNNGVMKLFKAEAASILVTQGSISNSGNALSVTVSAGTAAKLAWTHITTSSSGTPTGTCLFTCVYSSGFGNNNTWNANVSVTDSVGNTVTGLGSGHTLTVTLGGSQNGSLQNPGGSPVTLTIAATGPADSTAQALYKAGAGNNWTDTLTAHTASGTVYTDATTSFSK